MLLSSADRICNGIRYNSNGDRLIFLDTAGPRVIDLESFISGGGDEGKKKLTSAIEKDHRWVSNGVCCFAGANDELVVAASYSNDLHVWSVPQGRFDSSSIHQQIMQLTFKDQQIKGVFYNKHRSTLVHVVRVISSRHGLLSSCHRLLPIKNWKLNLLQLCLSFVAGSIGSQ